MGISPGDRIGHYEIGPRVGEGGMGVVYRALDTVLRREVALKFLTRTSAGRAAFSERLRQEARTLAALSHPHIVTIYEIGEYEGAPFLALEWIGGQTLASTLAGPRMTIGEFARVALPVADALAAAHERGIVHRDVKPANVLLCEDGRVKLADFGLALADEGEVDLTQTAGLLGTISYMSPEQANAGRPGPASDVFSFGVMAYQLLSGELPFKGAGPASILAAICAGRHEPLRRHRADLGADLDQVIERCLKVAPADRFADGRSLLLALRQALEGSRSSTVASVPSPRASRAPGSAAHQHIKYALTADGYSLAYSVVGQGPVIVRVLGYFTHLEMEWEWPELRRFWETLAEHYTVVRYDGRGMGMSDPFEGEFTEETRQRDLEAILDAAAPAQAALLGISEGGWTAATYAVAHPDRVSHLVLYGAYSRGARARPGYDQEEEEALETLIRKGWGRDTPAFRQVYTSQFFGKDADPRLVAHFNELQRVSAPADTAARYVRGLHSRGDGREMFRRVTVPTLVLHFRDDSAVSAEEGRLLASVIPGASLVILPHGAHYFPVDDLVLNKAADAIVDFLASA
jgi:serine/threonine protein kinase/alpha-beta hydrolase superfamily lysophospholipase